MSLDIRTIVFVQAFVYVLQLVVLVYQYALTKKYKGIIDWIFSNVFLGAAFFLSSLRGGSSLDFVFIVSNNVLYMIGLYLALQGLRKFLGIHGKGWSKVSLLFLFMGLSTCVSIYFSVFTDDLLARRINISLILALLAFCIAWTIASTKTRVFSRSAVFLFIIYAAYTLGFLARAIIALVFESQVTEAFDPASLQSVFYLLFMLLGVLVTFCYVLIVNESLDYESRQDKQNLQTIFDTSPDAVFITDLASGLLVKFNAGLLELTGHSEEDVRGKTTLDLKFWKRLEDRQLLVRTLLTKQSCNNLEFEFLTKSGKELTGLVSARTLSLNESPCVLSVVRDISDIKLIEQQLQNEIRAKNQLFSILAHDLKNSLGGTRQLSALM